MGLADAVLRRGHLSERSLIDVWTTGMRPAHLDRCDQCADRALEMSRWLEGIQVAGREDADAVCTHDALALQRSQIMSRLAQLDRPSKVISFPAAPPATRQPYAERRVSTGWLAAAAAAGLMIGVVSMELSHMLPFGGSTTTPPQVVTAPRSSYDDSELLHTTYANPSVGGLDALDDMTPRVVDVVLASNRNR